MADVRGRTHHDHRRRGEFIAWYQHGGWHFETFVRWAEAEIEQRLCSANASDPVPVDVPYAPLPDRAGCWVKRQHGPREAPVWTAEVPPGVLRFESDRYDASGRSGRLLRSERFASHSAADLAECTFDVAFEET